MLEEILEMVAVVKVQKEKMLMNETIDTIAIQSLISRIFNL